MAIEFDKGPSTPDGQVIRTVPGLCFSERFFWFNWGPVVSRVNSGENKVYVGKTEHC